MQRNGHYQSFAQDWPIERPQSFQILCLSMTTSLAYVRRPSSRLLMTRPIAYITYFNPQGRRVIIFGAKGLSRFPNVRPSVSKIVFLVRSCIDNEFQRSVSFVNEIDDVVYILTVLSFFIFIGCYYLFRTLSLSFYYTHYCKILLYYIIYQQLQAFKNKLSIYLSSLRFM